jgi:hypothetical protein
MYVSLLLHLKNDFLCAIIFALYIQDGGKERAKFFVLNFQQQNCLSHIPCQFKNSASENIQITASKCLEMAEQVSFC